MEYPKIETLFNRGEDFTVTDELRWAEFAVPKSWSITEKIDGTNYRVIYTPRHPTYFGGGGDGIEMPPSVEFRGRTDKADPRPDIDKVLADYFPLESLSQIFADVTSPVIIYGEAYGPKIQKGGGNYRDDISFRIFDVKVGDLWLNWSSVENIASQLMLTTVPVLCYDATLEQVVGMVKLSSRVAWEEKNNDIEHEGIVARTEPLLLTRQGRRLMFKLKGSDYRAGKR